MATDNTIATSLSNQVLDAGQPVEFNMPWYMSMAESYPGAPTMMAVAAGRGRNTMLTGAAPSRRGRGAGRRMTAPWKQTTHPSQWGSVRQGIANNNILRPRMWSRYASSDFFHDSGPSVNLNTGKTRYSPHGASLAMNAIGRGVTGTANSSIANRTVGVAGKAVSGFLDKRGMMPGAGEDFFSRGAVARYAAGSKVSGMSASQFASQVTNAKKFSAMGNFLGAAGYGDDALKGILGNQKATSQAYMMSGAGTISGRMGGYMAGMEGRATGDVLSGAGRSAKLGYGHARADIGWINKAAGRTVLDPTSRVTARRAASAGMEALKGARVAGKGAGNIALRSARLMGGVALRAGSRALPVVGWGLLAYDVAKLTAKSVGFAGKQATAAIKSYEGGSRKGVFGNSFQDTEASMTSRSRGVMAISNSRLNARSVLGSEAGQMAGYYG